MDRLLAMALEPSTWRGVGGVVVAAGLASGGVVNAVVAVGCGLISLVEVFRDETKK